MTSDDLARAESLIVTTPDFPEPGVLFRDITPLLADGPAFRAVVDAVIAPFAGQFDVVAGIEARGFILAGAVAIAAGVGMVPIRKAGKLPRPAASVDYDLEYGTATIQMSDDLAPGTRVLLVDDILATGGTLRAGHQLIAQLDLALAGTAVIIDLVELGGQEVCGPVHAVFRM
ncbi:adenine phosphoribosyltransferase [Microbacterium sp. bgisy203]|uniref:adenine phosphoribosyltransferase n=1 Tax=Microbacterium sp. bgisy203 TaxID=3413799 RepID=UPI003D70985F